MHNPNMSGDRAAFENPRFSENDEAETSGTGLQKLSFFNSPSFFGSF
jgi:hypothetical protein